MEQGKVAAASIINLEVVWEFTVQGKLPHPDNETAELVVFLSVSVLKDVTIEVQTVALGTSGEGRGGQPEFLVRLDCYFFRASALRNHRSSP